MLKVAFAAAAAVSFSLLVMSPVRAAETDTYFDIVRFEVRGNSLLPPERVDELVSPFIGRQKVYGDIQKALEALDNAYRVSGYGTVQVHVPEQELTAGVVKINVTESTVGKVVVTGNQFFDTANIRRSLPLLQEGAAPNMRALSENIQLANENPSKKVELTLGVAEEEGKVDAKVEVKDEASERFSLTLDNTGSSSSGVHRIGLSYQNSNIADLDQTLTLAYITALDAPPGVKVDIFSAGYRIPLYGLGDSIDLIYANSSTNTPATVLAPGNPLGINGKGEVLAFRYNHIFPRQGEYASRLVLGLDNKFINATCTNNGVPVPFGTSSACTPYTLRPVTATYSGQWQKPGEIIDFNLGLVHHLFPMGSLYPSATGTDRYSFVTGRPTTDTFTAFRFGGSLSRALAEDWLFRAAVSGQHARNALPAGEQLGLAGANAVRGLTERAVAADRGYVANLELYSPDYAGQLGLTGNLKGLVFYDWAYGHDVDATTTATNKHIASLGVGFRYNLGKDVAVRFDLAKILDTHQASPTTAEATKPAIRGHLSVVYGF
jgi:hemolysin activation/secretion protein